MAKTTSTKLQPQTVLKVDHIGRVLGLRRDRSRSTVIALAVDSLLAELETEQHDNPRAADAFKELLGADTRVVVELDEGGRPHLQRCQFEFRDGLPYVRRLGQLTAVELEVELIEAQEAKSDSVPRPRAWTIFLAPSAGDRSFRLMAGELADLPGARVVSTVGQMVSVPRQ